MPYARKYRRRRYRRRRRAPSRRRIYGAAATQLYRDVSKLKSMINVEYKFHDFQATERPSSTATVSAINFVNEGDTDQTHDGAMFRIKSIQMNGKLTLRSSATEPYQTRIALVLDTDAAASASTPTYSEIYDSTGVSVNAMRNLDNRSRFVILKQWDIGLSPNGREIVPIKFYRQVDYKCQIVGTASEANLRKNGLYVITMSNATTTDLVDFDYTTRIRYIDN